MRLEECFKRRRNRGKKICERWVHEIQRECLILMSLLQMKIKRKVQFGRSFPLMNLMRVKWKLVRVIWGSLKYIRLNGNLDNFTRFMFDYLKSQAIHSIFSNNFKWNKLGGANLKVNYSKRNCLPLNLL